MALILEKLPGISGDLARTDPDWESWDFVKLVEALHLWTRRNPIEQSNETRSRDREYRRPPPLGKLQWRRQVSEFGGAFGGQTHILGGQDRIFKKVLLYRHRGTNILGISPPPRGANAPGISPPL